MRIIGTWINDWCVPCSLCHAALTLLSLNRKFQHLTASLDCFFPADSLFGAAAYGSGRGVAVWASEWWPAMVGRGFSFGRKGFWGACWWLSV